MTLRSFLLECTVVETEGSTVGRQLSTIPIDWGGPFHLKPSEKIQSLIKCPFKWNNNAFLKLVFNYTSNRDMHSYKTSNHLDGSGL